MDRSDFYYRQIVTEGEMDQAFDDCENADRDIIEMLCKSGGWGVFDGLALTQQTVPDLTLSLSAGTAYDEQGRRIYLSAPTNIDFASLVDPTNSRRVRVEAEVTTTESDPRLDGNSNPLNYRLTESITVSLNAGPADGSNNIPARTTNKVSLGVVFLAAAETTLLTTDVLDWWHAEAQASDPNSAYEPHRSIGGFLPIAAHNNLDRWNGDHGILSFHPTYKAEIHGAELFKFRTLAQGGATDALYLGNRSIVDVDNLEFDDGSGGNGYIAMGAVGQGGDIRFVDQLEFDATSASNPALDMSGRNIGDVDELAMSSVGSANPAIDLNDRNIGEVNTLSFNAGGGGINLADCDISSTDGSNIDTGAGPSGGGYVKTHGGDVETGEAGSGGGQVRTHGGIIETDGGYLQTSGGDIRPGGGDITVANGKVSLSGTAYFEVSSTGSGYIRSGGRPFQYGSASKKVQRIWLSAADAMAASARWFFLPALSPGDYEYWQNTTLSGDGYDTLMFPVHLPEQCEIVSYSVKIGEVGAGNTTIGMYRSIPNFDLPSSAPSTKTLLAEATVTATSASGWTSPQDVLSADHSYNSGYLYYIIVTPSTAINAAVHAAEVIYKVDELRVGLH